MNQYVGVIEHKDIIKAYSWYSFFFNSKVSVYGNHRKCSFKFLKKNILVKKDNIGEFHSKWYEIQKYMVCESTYLDKLAIEKNILLRLLCKVFESKKVINFYKQYFSDIEYLVLRDKILSQKESSNVCFLFPYLHSYKVLANSYLKNNEYKFSIFLTLLFLIFGVKQFAGSIIKTILIKPVFVKKIKSKVLKRLVWKFGGKGLKDDMLIDELSVTKKDFVYYSESFSSKKIEKELYNKAVELGFNVVRIDNKFNINECYYNSFKNNFFYAALALVPALFLSPYFLFGIKKFNSKSFAMYKLLSFVEVDKFWSVGNWHDIAETVVLNNRDIRSFVYSWSDYAQSYLYPFTYTVQDDVFMWGPMENKYMIHKSLHENMYTIGCLFSNNFIEKDKEKIFRSLQLDSKKQLVVFYDSPVSNSMRFPKALFDEFREVILFVEKKYPNIQVVLKPKTVTDEYKDYFRNTSVKLLDSRDVYLGDIINISTINIGMGIVAPVAISLIMKKIGIFFETAGNYDSPFTKYEGELVFREQESLLQKIDHILNNKTYSPIQIDEMTNYNTVDASPVDILREYVATGLVSEKYRLINYMEKSL